MECHFFESNRHQLPAVAPKMNQATFSNYFFADVETSVTSTSLPFDRPVLIIRCSADDRHALPRREQKFHRR